jgi:hypothetical protein
MWATAIKWLFGTAMGRGVLLGGSIAIGAFASYYGFKTYHFNQGVASCEAGRLGDANAANVAQGERNIEQNKTSSEIAKDTDAEAAKVIADAERAKANSKESIHDVYKKAPVTAPIAVGSCVHPVDARVQERIRKARIAAAKARGT